MLEYVLMGAQAAGVVGDIWASSAAQSVAKRGQQLEESQLDLRLKQERVASQEQTIAGLEQLGEILATQRAMASIRGGLPGIGSNLAIEQKAVSTFNKDEKARAISLEFLGQKLQAQKSMGKLSLFGRQAETGAKLVNRGFNMLPLNQWAQNLESGNLAPIEKAKPTSTRKNGILTPAAGRGY